MYLFYCKKLNWSQQNRTNVIFRGLKRKPKHQPWYKRIVEPQNFRTVFTKSYWVYVHRPAIYINILTSLRQCIKCISSCFNKSFILRDDFSIFLLTFWAFPIFVNVTKIQRVISFSSFDQRTCPRTFLQSLFESFQAF